MQAAVRVFARVATVLVAGLGVSSAAEAGDFSSSATYNTPAGMQQPAQENQPVDPSLRDQNGNLTIVNGQFTSEAAAKAYANANAGTSSGVSSNGSGAGYGGASAIGNSLNVVTVGNNNTVVVNSNQTNSGNVSATVNVNGNH